MSPTTAYVLTVFAFLVFAGCAVTVAYMLATAGHNEGGFGVGLLAMMALWMAASVEVKEK